MGLGDGVMRVALLVVVAVVQEVVVVAAALEPVVAGTGVGRRGTTEAAKATGAGEVVAPVRGGGVGSGGVATDAGRMAWD